MTDRDSKIADMREMLDYLQARPDVPMHEVDVYEWDCPPSILAPVEPPS